MELNLLGKFSPRKLSLRYKVLSLFAVAIILPSIFFCIIITSVGKNNLRDSIFVQQEEILSRLQDKINAQLDLHLKLLSFKTDINSLKKKQKVKYIKNIFEKGNAFSEIMVFDSKNKEILKLSKEGKGKLKDTSARAVIFNNSISQVFFSKDENPYVFVKVSLQDRGNIIARLDFNQLVYWVNEIKLGNSGQVFIVDKKGNLIAHKETERVAAKSNFGSLPIVRDFINNQKPPMGRWKEYSDERGQKVVAIYKTIPRLGWAVITQVPSTEVYKPVENINKGILIGTILWVTAFLFIGLSFVKKIIDPLLLLRSGVDKISKGNLDIKLNIRTGDEIEEVSSNFEKMADELKKLETMKEDLTRMIIHDLKSPLSGIMGSLDYLNSGYATELTPDQKNIIELAKKSCENMVSMVQNLLDIAKMEAGKLELKKERVNITDLLRSRHEEFIIQALNEKKELSITLDENLPEVEVEKNIIERVVNNLINNAIKHTSSGGKIQLAASGGKKFLKISVSDDGPGIPEEFKKKIFEKFVQIERNKSKLRTGAGLGLNFCKMAIEAHGGNIWVESEAESGSSFIFTLPLQS